MAYDRNHVVPTLTDDAAAGDRIDDQRSVVNGHGIDVRLTHPGLYRIRMVCATLSILLGLNFLILNPTFLIYGAPNSVWAGIFLALGIGEMVFLNVFRRLRFVRMVMVASFVYIVLIAYGTCWPFFEGEGSLQLPLLYLGWAFLQAALLLEPFINPWTAR